METVTSEDNSGCVGDGICNIKLLCLKKIAYFYIHFFILLVQEINI